MTAKTTTLIGILLALGMTACFPTAQAIAGLVCMPIVSSEDIAIDGGSELGGCAGPSALPNAVRAVDDCVETSAWIVTLEYARGSGSAKIAAFCGSDTVADCTTTAANSPCEDEGTSTSGTPDCIHYVLSGDPDGLVGACEDPVTGQYLESRLVELHEDPMAALQDPLGFIG